MKVSSRVNKAWLSELPSDSDSSSTEFIGSKTELLSKHIEAFLKMLEEVSATEQELGQLLEVLLSSIKTKNKEVI